MSQFKNTRICSLHFSADGEGTSAALPSKNIPDFERQEAAAGLLQLTVPYMESNQRNIDVHQIYPDTSTENTGNILQTAVYPNPITEPQTIACSDTSMEDTGNVLKTVEDIISMTTPQATANDDDMIISQKSLFTSRWTPDQIRKRKLFRYSTLQVTPKKSKDSIGIQRSPTKQKHT